MFIGWAFGEDKSKTESRTHYSTSSTYDNSDSMITNTKKKLV